MQLREFIKCLMANQIPFTSYRLPGQELPVTLAGGFFSTDLRYAKGDSFVLAPFHPTEKNPIRFYLPFFEIEGWETNADFGGFNCNHIDQIEQPLPTTVEFEEYCRHFSVIMKLLKSGELKKAVLSRVIKTDMKHEPGVLFEKLCKAYPNAFIYLYNNGAGECWAGASPESLLYVNDKKGKTMSLAGTKTKTLAGEVQWGQKEIEEQQYVTDYISGKLHEAHVKELHTGERQTVIAGKLAHLCTTFSFSLPENLSAFALALQLHPTPAVCGLPTEAAKNTILQVEQHDRGLYTGFLGPLSNKGDAGLFVNLRCMKIVGEKAYLFVGGGLTADSVLENEWDETSNKAETLLAFLRD